MQIAERDHRPGGRTDQLCTAADERRQQFLQTSGSFVVLRLPRRLEERIGQIGANSFDHTCTEVGGLPGREHLCGDRQHERCTAQREGDTEVDGPATGELDLVVVVGDGERDACDQDDDERLEQTGGCGCRRQRSHTGPVAAQQGDVAAADGYRRRPYGVVLAESGASSDPARSETSLLILVAHLDCAPWVQKLARGGPC